MKQLTVKSIGDPVKKTMGTLELLKNAQKPVPNDGELLIKVAYNGICGSDGHLLRGNLGPVLPKFLAMMEAGPLGIGHEYSGVVEEVTPAAEKAGFKKGDRVTCNYFHGCHSCYWCKTGRENFCSSQVEASSGCSEYIVVDTSQAHKIPDNLSLKCAAMTEPFTIAFNAVERAKVRMGSRVAVFGGGAIGQMIAMLAKAAGAASVTMFEPIEDKRKMALELGADFVFDSIREDVEKVAAEHTDGLGFDSVIEASGSPAAAVQALKVLANDGNVVYFAMYPIDFELPVNLFSELYHSQKHINGMWLSANIWPRAIAELARINVEPLIQKVYTLDEYEEAFNDHMSGAYPKVMIHCNPDLE